MSDLSLVHIEICDENTVIADHVAFVPAPDSLTDWISAEDLPLSVLVVIGRKADMEGSQGAVIVLDMGGLAMLDAGIREWHRQQSPDVQARHTGRFDQLTHGIRDVMPTEDDQ